MTTNKLYPLNHDGNAMRILDHFGDLMRYDPATETWLFWKGTRWVMEKDKNAQREIVPYAVKLATELLPNEAARRVVSDPPGAQLIFEWAKKTHQALAATVAAVKLRAHDFYASLGEWDSDESNHLITMNNGTFDLREGVLREHQADDKLTRRIYVTYDPQATCPLFDRIMLESQHRDQELVTLLLDAGGYTLTGETGEQCFFFCYGPPHSGKSTFVQTLRQLMAGRSGQPMTGYAEALPVAALMKQRNSSAHGPTPAIADLRGARMAHAIETNQGEELNESLVKTMTGEDNQKARQLYGANFEFINRAKIWMAGNHKPRIPSPSKASWRRLILIEFTHVVEKRFRGIHQELKKELPGIFNRIAPGAKKWYERDGLFIPERVKALIEDYRREEDMTEQFVSEECEIGPAMENGMPSKTYRTEIGEFFLRFQTYCQDNREREVARSYLTDAMRSKGFEQKPINGKRYWLGIRLKPLGGVFGVRTT